MSNFRTFEVNDRACNMRGIISIRLDEEENSVFEKLRKMGFKLNKRINKLDWGDGDYVEVMNKITRRTVAVMERCYN